LPVGDGISIEIEPEPTEAEREAIVIAFRLAVLQTAHSSTAPAQSAWALAGRREVLQGRPGGARAGWGRVLNRLAGS
jgi:hypothetical protein